MQQRKNVQNKGGKQQKFRSKFTIQLLNLANQHSIIMVIATIKQTLICLPWFLCQTIWN